MENLSKRQTQAYETKKRIYLTTVELAEKYGFQKLKIQDVCKAAGVSVGTFYNYYKSLDFIVWEGYRYDKYVEQCIQEHPLEGSCIDKILKLLQYKMEFVTEFGVDFMIQLFRSHLEQVSEENSVFINKNRIMPVLISEIIDIGKESGELVVPDDLSLQQGDHVRLVHQKRNLRSSEKEPGNDDAFPHFITACIRRGDLL